VLDLFAGSGALGLEALSRGAVSADFVEIHRLAVSSLKVNITLLKVDDRTVVHRVDALKFAEQLHPGQYDVAFADPPYASGDPARRPRTLADRVIVAVAVNVAKQPLFTLEERVALIRRAVQDPSVEVRSFDGLLAEFAIAVGATVIVRGLRAVSDFEYEFQMALMNRNLAPGIE